jgi:outer membrane protein assembly factor BamB
MQRPWFPTAVVLSLTLACATADAPRAATASDGNVPRFLTGRQVEKTDAPHPPERWSATGNVAWKTDVPGLAWSSPIVWDGHIYLTTCAAVGEGTTREPRKGLYIEDLDANKYPDKVERAWKICRLNLGTGATEWERLAYQGIPAKPHHIKNTLASETPATDGERIYALFGNLGLFCYGLDGAPLWTHRIPPRETRYAW